jgi:transposase
MFKRPRRNHPTAFKAAPAKGATRQWPKSHSSTRCTPRKSPTGGDSCSIVRPTCLGGATAPSAPAVDPKALHARTGQLALENDFLNARSPRRDCERRKQECAFHRKQHRNR